MRRLAVLALLLALAFPGAAGAAPLGELPFQERGGVAGCLEATGAPGGLSVLGPYSRRESATDLLTAGGVRDARVSLGRLLACASVAEAPGGAAIVAGAAVPPDDYRYVGAVRVAVREPGGAFGPPVTLGRSFARPAVAVAPSGAAAVAWVAVGSSRDSRRRLIVARRAPGGPFGPPETVMSWPADFNPEAELQAAIDAAGAVTVLLNHADGAELGGNRLDVATAAPGAGFSVQRLTARADDPALSVAPDGWALITHGRGALEVFERAPRAVGFSAVAVPEPRGRRFGDPTIAVRSGGGAVVAWRTGESMTGVDALTRESAGPFTARRVAEPVRIRGSSAPQLDLHPAIPFEAPPVIFDSPRLQAAVAPDGRVVLAWPSRAGRPPLAATTLGAAVGGLDGGFEPARTLGSPMRNANDLAVLFTADGRAAVAWTDNPSRASHGRLHVALEGAASAPRPAPRLRVTVEAGQRLYPSSPVRARVRCSAACDLRTIVTGRRGAEGARSFTLRRPGSSASARRSGRGRGAPSEWSCTRRRPAARRPRCVRSVSLSSGCSRCRCAPPATSRPGATATRSWSPGARRSRPAARPSS